MNRGVLFFALAMAHAQSTESFDVASIKPSDPSTYGRVSINTSHGDYIAEGVTVKSLISGAYEVHEFQIEGLPKWAESERYDIKAKTDEDPPAIDAQHIDPVKLQVLKEQHKKMELRLQALLAQRFALKLHRATKEMPVYVLSQAKSGAKLNAAKAPDDFANSGVNIHNGNLIATNLTIEDFTQTLSGQTDRIVIDKTGLAGRYDFTLDWIRDDRTAERVPANAPVGPSLFTALQEQLGLKLSADKAPAEVLVIESVQKPSPN